MTKSTLLLGIHLLATLSDASSQELDKAEVRIPYSELKQLLSRAEPAAKQQKLKPALLSARLVISIEDGIVFINGNFRATSFSDEMSLVPLISGDISLESQQPQDAQIIANESVICLATDKPGLQNLQLRLLPIHPQDGFKISLPPCPSVIFETGSLPPDQSIVIDTGETQETLASGKLRPLLNTGQPLKIRLLDSSQTRDALAPPEPSTWTWQHQALVHATDADLTYQVLARASAGSGSGVAAMLPLPTDAQDITVTGDDIISQSTIRGENRSLNLSLNWKTRGILDRLVMISYRMPLRPLDKLWKLQAPGGDGTRTRFIIASNPLLSFVADGLSGPLTSQGLPEALALSLKGANCHQLEGGATADITVTSIPVAATADGVVDTAEWLVKIEPDGALLLTGSLTIEHKNPLGFEFDTPEGMKLLSCDLNAKPTPPVDLGNGKLMVSLPATSQKSLLVCSFTGNQPALDPVEGTLKLTLPKTPLFIHSLLWNLEMPTNYQAETHGNVKRLTSTTSTGNPRISLRKNLCHDERPEVNVFYQRNNLSR